MKFLNPPEGYKAPTGFGTEASPVRVSLLRWITQFVSAERPALARVALRPAMFTVAAHVPRESVKGFELIATDGRTLAAVPVAVRGDPSAIYGLAAMGRPMRIHPDALSGVSFIDTNVQGGGIVLVRGRFGNRYLPEEDGELPTEQTCTLNEHVFPKVERVLPEAVGGTFPRTDAAPALVIDPAMLSRIGSLAPALRPLENRGVAGITMTVGAVNDPISFVSSPLSDRMFSHNELPTRKTEDLHFTRRAIAVIMPLARAPRT